MGGGEGGKILALKWILHWACAQRAHSALLTQRCICVSGCRSCTPIYSVTFNKMALFLKAAWRAMTDYISLIHFQLCAAPLAGKRQNRQQLPVHSMADSHPWNIRCDNHWSLDHPCNISHTGGQECDLQVTICARSARKLYLLQSRDLEIQAALGPHWGKRVGHK